MRVRPAPPRAPLRGLDRRELRGRGGDRPRPRPGPGLPTVIRVSDEEETQGSLALSGPRGRGRAGSSTRYLGLRTAPRRRADDRRLRGRGGVGRAPPGADACGRCAAAAPPTSAAPPGAPGSTAATSGPYLRDTLMGMGAMVETLETSHTWTRLGELHRAVAAAIGGALEGQGTPGLVCCHLSHAYADGASLYFTFISRARRGAELEQWAAVKRAACEAIVANGRDDHPPPRGRPRPRPLHGGRGGGDGTRGRCARSRSASTRPGS